MRKVLALLGLLAVFAFGGASSCDPEQQGPARTALLGCETITSQLNILLPLRRDGKLSPEIISLIDKQRGISDPYCLGPAPNVDSTVKDITLDGVARSLTGIVGAVQ